MYASALKTGYSSDMCKLSSQKSMEHCISENTKSQPETFKGDGNRNMQDGVLQFISSKAAELYLMPFLKATLHTHEIGAILNGHHKNDKKSL